MDDSMDVEDATGCLSCMDTKELRNLFGIWGANKESYAEMLDKCFEIKVPEDLKNICSDCASKLEMAASFKEQTYIGILQHRTEDEEYLDEKILEEEQGLSDDIKDEKDDSGDEYCGDENTICAFCSAQFISPEKLKGHVYSVHVLKLGEETIPSSIEEETSSSGRSFPCHFCDKVFNGRKACYTHLRMKHGLKCVSAENMPKKPQRERQFCHICSKGFSQKQFLNKHLWKEHGFEMQIEKRKAYLCPLCDERVSYGSHFEHHLLHEHHFQQHIRNLEFRTMDDFLLYKNKIQEETKCRFRKTTGSRPTVEGLRSHYMCSQSGVYVYQGKGIRPAPERQIYKTGKACPAHMVVTETMDRVLVTFYSKHVGHGDCPYYIPRYESKSNVKTEPGPSPEVKTSKETVVTPPPDTPCFNKREEMEDGSCLAWICDSCGAEFLDGNQFRMHAAAHGRRLYPCQSCDRVFQNVEAWSKHFRSEHNFETLYSSSD